MQGLPVSGNHIFGRAMMYFASPWAGSHIRVIELLNINHYVGYALDLTNLRGFMGTPFWLEQLVDHRAPGTISAAFNQWLCVEWEVDAPNPPLPPPDGGTPDSGHVDSGNTDSGPPDAGPPAVVRAWINYQDLAPEPMGYTQTQILSFHIGYFTATAATPTDMWIDDVALGTERVGCP
jgi:hypothetical protein